MRLSNIVVTLAAALSAALLAISAQAYEETFLALVRAVGTQDLDETNRLMAQSIEYTDDMVSTDVVITLLDTFSVQGYGANDGSVAWSGAWPRRV